MYQPDEIDEKKKAFAAAFLRYPLDPERAATIADERPHYAAYICTHWLYDADVQRYMREIRTAKGDRARIPTKEEFVEAIFTDANGVQDKETKLKYYRLLAETMGFIERPAQTQVHVGNVTKNNVMLVPHFASVEDWEASAMAAQSRLINASAEK